MTNVTVKLACPLKSVRIIDKINSDKQAVSDGEINKLAAELEAQKNLYAQVCQTLEKIADKMNTLYEEVYVQQGQQIARLSVEIARKILMQKVQDGDYEIESIIKEILKNAPSKQDVVVRLSPKDYEYCKKIQNEQNDNAFRGILFVSDDGVGNAECVLESPGGIIKSVIDEHLEEITKALVKAG